MSEEHVEQHATRRPRIRLLGPPNLKRIPGTAVVAMEIAKKIGVSIQVIRCLKSQEKSTVDPIGETNIILFRRAGVPDTAPATSARLSRRNRYPVFKHFETLYP